MTLLCGDGVQLFGIEIRKFYWLRLKAQVLPPNNILCRKDTWVYCMTLFRVSEPFPLPSFEDLGTFSSFCWMNAMKIELDLLMDGVVLNHIVYRGGLWSFEVKVEDRLSFIFDAILST